MEHILKWVYLLENNWNLLKVKIDNNIENDIKESFNTYYLLWENLKNYTLVDYNLDDDTQNECKVDLNNIPLFWEIKTKILNHTENIQVINSNILSEIENKIINSWIFQFLYMDDNWNRKNILLFQSFYKPNMYITPTKFTKVIGLLYSWTNNSFWRKNYTDEVLNINKNIDVIYLDWEEIYILDRKKYINIFNHYEFIKNEAKKIFINKIVTNNLFEIEDSDEFTIKIWSNYQVAKKIYIINKSWILDWLDLINFWTHISSYNWLSNIEVINNKIKITTDNFKAILEVLNEEYQKCELTWNKFKVNAKKRI